MNRHDRLLAACRVLFGHDLEISADFLGYLQESGVSSAYRKRALEVHPDRSVISGLCLQQCREEFAALQAARAILQHYIAAREGAAHCRMDRATPGNTNPLQASSLPEEKLLFGRFLYRLGIIDWRQLIMALAWQKSSRPRIGELGVKMGYFDRNAVVMILKNSVKTGSFGVTAHKMGLLSADQVRQLLLYQQRQQQKIGQFFIEHDLLNTSELHELLRQCNQHNRRVESLVEPSKKG